MDIKSRSDKRVCFAALMLLCLSGCALGPRLYLPYAGESRPVDLEKILAENPLGASENMKIATLGQDQSMSYHIVQVRDREAPHIHKTHDGTVVMMKGRGYLMIDNQRIDLSISDVVFIPRDVVHYYVNTASEPTIAFVTFTPPFDGKDTVPVTAR